MKFLSVVCSALLVILVGSLMQSPAAVDQPTPIVSPEPVPPTPDDQGSPVVPIGQGGCRNGVCPTANNCDTCQENPANGGDCEHATKRPLKRAAVAPLRVGRKVVAAPVRLVGRLFGRRR
jgi:hypothetical protein